MENHFFFFWSGILLAIFYLFYLCFLRRETFFVLNRIYLLASLFLSVLVPLIDFSTLIAIPKTELIVSAFSVLGTEKLTISVEKQLNWLPAIYWTGVLLAAIVFLIRLFNVKMQMKLMRKGQAFSFWKTKVIDSGLDNFAVIDAHENVHLKQLHTLDLLLIEVMNIFFWFNPLIYCYRKSLKLIHEYLADEHAAGYAGSKKQYAMVLFLQNFKTGPAFANTFYSPSLLESRIKMLQSKKSETYRLWKYTLSIPLIVLLMMLCAFSTSDFDREGKDKPDRSATFPGGFEAFAKYLKKSAKKVSDKDGRVKVSFIIETNGEISNEKIENSVDKASDEEALRVIKLSPKWNPAMQSGEKVRSSYQIGVNFVSDNQ